MSENHPDKPIEKKAPVDQSKPTEKKEIADEQLDKISGGVKPLGYIL